MKLADSGGCGRNSTPQAGFRALAEKSSFKAAAGRAFIDGGGRGTALARSSDCASRALVLCHVFCNALSLLLTLCHGHS